MMSDFHTEMSKVTRIDKHGEGGFLLFVMQTDEAGETLIIVFDLFYQLNAI